MAEDNRSNGTESPTTQLIREGAALLSLVIRSILDIKVLIGVCLTYLGYVFLLPVGDRHTVGFDKLLTFLSTSPVLWMFGLGGWGLLALVLVVGIPLYRSMQKRIESQGTELQVFRTAEDPNRMSSKNPEALNSYVTGGQRKEKAESASPTPGENVRVVVDDSAKSSREQSGEASDERPVVSMKKTGTEGGEK